MMQSHASVRSHVATFDDTSWNAKIEAFRQYLTVCHQALAVSRKGYTDAKAGHIDTNAAKAPKPKTNRSSSARYQATGVYLLPAGVSREAATESTSRRFVAPLWASIGDERERKAA
jgi:hypothetical protein